MTRAQKRKRIEEHEVKESAKVDDKNSPVSSIFLFHTILSPVSDLIFAFCVHTLMIFMNYVTLASDLQF